MPLLRLLVLLLLLLLFYITAQLTTAPKPSPAPCLLLIPWLKEGSTEGPFPKKHSQRTIHRAIGTPIQRCMYVTVRMCIYLYSNCCTHTYSPTGCTQFQSYKTFTVSCSCLLAKLPQIRKIMRTQSWRHGEFKNSQLCLWVFEASNSRMYVPDQAESGQMSNFKQTHSCDNHCATPDFLAGCV